MNPVTIETRADQTPHHADGYRSTHPEKRRGVFQRTPTAPAVLRSHPSGHSHRDSAPTSLRRALPVFLGHASPRLLVALVSVLVPLRLWWGEWSAWDVVPVCATLALWPILEWLIHVFILHFKPLNVWGYTIDPRVPRKHRAHHRDPWNYEILFIPFQSFTYSLPITAILWWVATPTVALALTRLTVHTALALHYEWIHFLVHTRVSPRSRYYQRIWKNHRLHHFKNERYWYGVTRLEGDWVLHTAPAANAVPLSPTARTLLADSGGDLRA